MIRFQTQEIGWTTSHGVTCFKKKNPERFTARSHDLHHKPWTHKLIHGLAQAVTYSRGQPFFSTDAFTVSLHGLHHKPWTHHLIHGMAQAVNQHRDTLSRRPEPATAWCHGLTQAVTLISTTRLSKFQKPCSPFPIMVSQTREPKPCATPFFIKTPNLLHFPSQIHSHPLSFLFPPPLHPPTSWISLF